MHDTVMCQVKCESVKKSISINAFELIMRDCDCGKIRDKNNDFHFNLPSMKLIFYEKL
jgi:hypothetical protein